jgi:putative transposase
LVTTASGYLTANASGWLSATGCSDWLELDFVVRERTPIELIKLGIRLHLAGLSLSNTVSELANLGVQRSRKAVHDWVQKADLQPASDASPDHVAVDETVIQLNGQRYWLYAAVDPETDKFHHVCCLPPQQPR